MDEKHPKNIDPRPKRRRAKDNPYELFTVGIEIDRPHYFIRFTDGTSVEHCFEIEKALYDLLDQFELDDLSYLNEVDRHYERSEQTEASLHNRAVAQTETVEETVFRDIKYQKLHSAIQTLPSVQRRRLTLRYFGEYTYEQIAEMEGCTPQAIAKTIMAAEKNLKKILKEG